MEITGRLTKDAVLVKINNDKQVINFSIAINDSYKIKGDSQRKEVVTYFNCDYWLSTAVLPYLKKGCVVQLFGRIGLSAYLSTQGNPLASFNFHVNTLKILVFAKKQVEISPIAGPSKNTEEADPDDLPF
ncbi:single-stranded DNA-binding protein [compost metagenome]